MDSIFLTGPLGTTFNVGSWLDKTQPVDYGGAGIVRQQLTQTTFVDGAQLAYETAAGARKMSFPLTVPSGGVAGLSLDTIEASLRQMVRPGGYVDMQPANVPTAEMVRFDVLGGDVAQRGYSVDLRRISRGLYTLSLETQPLGYWPTWITLASVASVAPLPDVRVPIRAASVIGDMPAFVRLAIRSDVAVGTTGGTPGARQDFQAWSLAAASAPLVFGASGLLNTNAIVGTAFDSSASWITGNASAGVARASAPFGSLVSFWNIWALDRKAFGRHRAFAFIRHGGGNSGSLRALIDVTGRDTSPAIATGNPIATIPAVASLGGASYFGVYDLGEITVPQPLEASGYPSWSGQLRLWIGGASDGSNATTICDVAGVILLPVGGPAGIMPRGLVLPGPASQIGAYNLIIDSQARMKGLRAFSNTSLDVGNEDPWQTALRSYRDGGLPFVGGTDTTLQILTFERYTAGTPIASDYGPPVRRNTVYVGYSLSYRPRFSFLKGI